MDAYGFGQSAREAVETPLRTAQLAGKALNETMQQKVLQPSRARMDRAVQFGADLRNGFLGQPKHPALGPRGVLARQAPAVAVPGAVTPLAAKGSTMGVPPAQEATPIDWGKLITPTTPTTSIGFAPDVATRSGTTTGNPEPATPDYADIMARVPQGGSAIANIMASREAQGRATDLYNRAHNRFKQQQETAKEGREIESHQQALDRGALDMSVIKKMLPLQTNEMQAGIDKTRSDIAGNDYTRKLMTQAQKSGISPAELLKIESKDEIRQNKIAEKLASAIPQLQQIYPDPLELQNVLATYYSSLSEAGEQVGQGKTAYYEPAVEEVKGGIFKKGTPGRRSTLTWE